MNTTIAGMILAMLTAAMSAMSGNAVDSIPEPEIIYVESEPEVIYIESEPEIIYVETEPQGRYADCGVILQDGDIAETEDGNYQITITMQNGNMFSFISEDGDWMEGELVAVIFDDNNTPEVSDDIIIGQPHYSGWVSDAELANWIK